MDQPLHTSFARAWARLARTAAAASELDAHSAHHEIAPPFVHALVAGLTRAEIREALRAGDPSIDLVPFEPAFDLGDEVRRFYTRAV